MGAVFQSPLAKTRLALAKTWFPLAKLKLNQTLVTIEFLSWYWLPFLTSAKISVRQFTTEVMAKLVSVTRYLVMPRLKSAIS